MIKKNVLPNINQYLKHLEVISNCTSKCFPCSCQESSIFLYLWLKKNEVNCEIILGDYKDPVIKDDSMHYWLENNEFIIDGSAIQFSLDKYRNMTYEELNMVVDIQNCNLLFDKQNNNYHNRVNAYIPKRLEKFIKKCVNDMSYNFDDAVDIFLNNLYDKINYDFKVMTLSSLYKNNQIYYNLDYDQFVKKCINYGIHNPQVFIERY